VALVAVVFSEQALGVPVRRLVPRLRAEAGQIGISMFDVLGVTPVAFRSLLCRYDSCCPMTGRPIGEVETSRTASLQALRAAVRAACPDEGSAGERLAWFEQWYAKVESPDAPDGSLPGMAAAMRDIHLRDAVLLHLAGSPTGHIAAVLAGPARSRPRQAVHRSEHESGASSAEAQITQMRAAFSRPPDHARLSRGEAWLDESIRSAPPGSRGDALAVLAILAWLDARPSRARWLAGRARADTPGLTLIGLIDDLLARRIPPPWSIS
jgi:hypothetical protein